MKKIIALALSLMMILGCVSALAEGEKETLTVIGAFDIKYSSLPEGYTMEVAESNGTYYSATIAPKDPTKPVLSLQIEFNDSLDGVNKLTDATPEDMAAIKQSFYEIAELDEGDIIFEETTTGHGTPLLIAKTKDGSIAAVYTIYMSHEIEIDMFFADGKTPVTDEHVKAVVDFLTDVEFVETAAPAETAAPVEPGK